MQHTITITIPTGKILAVGAGLVVGLVLGAALAYGVVHHVELWAPVFGLPALMTVCQTPQEAARPAPARDLHQAGDRIHPAVAAFDRVPLPVRVALDRMVDRVLMQKYLGEMAA